MNLYNLAFSEQRSARIRRHMLFWVVWCFYWLTAYLIPTQWVPAWNLRGPMPQIEHYGFIVSGFRILINTTLMTIIYMSLTYGILYFFLPRYVSKSSNWISTTLLLLLFISAIAIINYFFFLFTFSITTRLGYFGKMPGINFILPIWGRQILFNYPTVVGFALAIKLFKNWYLKQKEAAQVGREIINSELQLLKAQIHPHFLFNTLNNIYSFIINGSHGAGEAIKRLSALLKYIIYECDQPLVKLEKELKMIRDYIGLERIRYGENFNLSLEIRGNASNKTITPLLLIPFLENSFKHGASQMLTHPWIKLEITIDKNHLFFDLSNSKPSLDTDTSFSKGLGLRNVKKRLSILYPGIHALDITDDVMSFTISLKVPLFQSDENELEINHEKARYELV